MSHPFERDVKPETLVEPKPPAVFLVTIRIVATRPGDARHLAKMIADAAELLFEKKTAELPKTRKELLLNYELNLSKWESI